MPPEESPESKFDRLKKQLQDSILRDYPNPERKGCPSGAVLQELAERPLDRPVEDDPHWQHITHCSECYREFLAFNNAFRQQAKARRVRVGWGVAAAAIVIVIAVLFGIKQGALFEKRPQNAELAWVKRTVEVPSTSRAADSGEQKPIYLERLPLELTIVLPVGSKAGAYELQLKMSDRTVVSTGGTAEIQNGTTSFAARINLSQLEPGSYSMVIRQVPLDWNLYPVVIR
ncbi:MAG TPA: hypothetical protein VMF91_09950 [Bryobacteraceae bacterium]|nr:hypothetical protein [Bryobacteraceae bacterium]